MGVDVEGVTGSDPMDNNKRTNIIRLYDEARAIIGRAASTTSFNDTRTCVKVLSCAGRPSQDVNFTENPTAKARAVERQRRVLLRATHTDTLQGSSTVDEDVRALAGWTREVVERAYHI